MNRLRKQSAPLSFRLWIFLLATLLGAALLFRISVTPDRFLDVDELEHLNAAYAIGHGETLYGTLFENHPPLLVWSLQPFVRALDDAESLIRAARWWMLLPCLGLLGAVSRIGFLLSGWGGALASPLFLLSSVSFFEKGVEIRPDVPGAFFAFLGMLLLVQAGPRGLLTAGVSLGIAGFFTPKALFAALGMLAGRALYSWISARMDSPSPDARHGASPRSGPLVRTFTSLGWVAIGTATVVAFVAFVLALQGSWNGFWQDCVQTSARMTIDDPGAMRHALLTDSMLRGNPASWLLGALGALWSLRLAQRGASYPHQDVDESRRAALYWMIPLSLVASFAGFFLMNAPLRQYFLFVLPQLAIAAAFVVDRMLSGIRRQALSAAAGIAFLAAMLIPPWTSILPVQRQGVEVEILRTVLATARPGERVLDLWSGLYLTRLPAYRYFFLNSDVIRLLPASRLEQDLERVLNDPTVTVVIADDHFALLPHAIQQRIRSEFTLVEDYGFLAVLTRRPS